MKKKLCFFLSMPIEFINHLNHLKYRGILNLYTETE